MRSLVETARGEIRAAIGELSDPGRGIQPAVLASQGLAAAAETLAALATLPVTVRIEPGRHPAATESAAYFVIAEALANIARHARACTAQVTARCGGRQLTVEVRDDGIGGASAGEGTGLAGLADRVAALGGQLSVISPPVAGPPSGPGCHAADPRRRHRAAARGSCPRTGAIRAVRFQARRSAAAMCANPRWRPEAASMRRCAPISRWSAGGRCTSVAGTEG